MPPPREYSPRATLISALVVGGLIAWSYWHRPAPEIVDPDIRGTTMGDIPVLVRMAGVRFTETEWAAVQADISGALDDVNHRLSTWRPDSEINRVNTAAAGEVVPVSDAFATVYRRAAHWHHQTHGAFDPGISPLVGAYGFGAYADADLRPAHLEALRAACGLRHFSLSPSNTVTKTRADARLDFGAIAKGYAVDQVMAVLRARGVTRAMVEVGGEVAAMGNSPAELPWRIGIERPEPGVAPGTLAEGVQPVPLREGALAGSGGYRQFHLTEDGKPVPHILDPRGLQPVSHHTVAVHVYSDTCMDADAVATALFVMGAEEGMAWAHQQPGIEALFIDRDASGFSVVHTPGFPGQPAP